MTNLTSSNLTPGLTYPKLSALPSSTARDSAITTNNGATRQLSALLKVGGKRSDHKRSYRKKGTIKRRGGTVVVPQLPVSYNSGMASGQDPNSQIAQLSQIGSQGAANRVYDKFAQQGGNTLNWGCYSGGKRKRSNRKRSNRKHK